MDLGHMMLTKEVRSVFEIFTVAFKSKHQDWHLQDGIMLARLCQRNGHKKSCFNMPDNLQAFYL